MTLSINSSFSPQPTLASARTEATNALQTQAAGVAQAVTNLNTAFNSVQNTLAAQEGQIPTGATFGTPNNAPALASSGLAEGAAPADVATFADNSAAPAAPATTPGLGAADQLSLSAEAEVALVTASQNEASIIDPIVDLQVATTAFLANLEALEVVNDLERETIDILS